MPKAYLRSDLVKVKQSPIHGKGLFAKKQIKEGTELGCCKVTAIKPELDGPYVLTLEQGACEVLCDLKYINHNSEPNVAYYEDLTVVALTDIAPGEELTHHYGDEWDEQA